MTITLFCLVKENTTANAFPVHIDKGQFVSELKEVIKAKKQNDFAGVDANKFKLWKKGIPDDQNDLLSKLTLNDGNRLLATKEIRDYWTEKPPKRHIRVIVSPSESTATSNQEVKELLDHIVSLEEALSKFEYGM
jgi:hypothetical protein